MTQPPNPNLLLHGGSSYIPLSVAVCPECGAPLHCQSMAWVTETGMLIAEALRIECLGGVPNNHKYHKYHQADWQHVRDAVEWWAGAES